LRKFTWFAKSANEWTASDNILAEPVCKYAPNLKTITVKLLNKEG
jgi:hypothetical protein